MKNDKFLDWLAGFIDGEGSFNIARHKGRRDWTTMLRIGLRDDDIDILLTIQEKLEMGVVHRFNIPPEVGHPGAGWSIYSQQDCQRFVGLMQGHPLLTKKRRDFQTWKEAVAEIAKGHARSQQKLQYLKRKLEFTRRYRSIMIEDLSPPEEQLQLPWELSDDKDNKEK